jgi:hypothetical protein
VKLLPRTRPSAALIVACLALFVSLSGVSYGVATGFIDSREIKNNEVRSVDLRNNQIRSRDIRNNEVRGIDIRNSTVQSRDIAINAVQGVDVKEDTLGKVPSAGTADSATSATSAGSVSTLRIVPVTTLAEGSSPVALATHGPLTLRAECAAGPTARLEVSTTEDNSAAAGAGSSVLPDAREPDLDAANSPFEVAALGGMAIPYALRTVSAFAPSGKAFSGEIGMYHDAADTCRFHGHLTLQG